MIEDFGPIRERAARARQEGRQVVVVQGLGFVGSAMAAVTATSTDESGRPAFFVIGVDLATETGMEKIRLLNEGRAVVDSDDARLSDLTREAVRDGSLVATSDPDAYALADVVVVDLPLDVKLSDSGGIEGVSMDGFRRAVRTVGDRVDPTTLILVETTVPPGTVREVVLPALRASFSERGLTEEPLVAHSYERVTPGPNYVDSIRSFWRCFAGNGPVAGAQARQFLSRVVDVERFPLFEFSSIEASEISKVLENSYRAVNIAFIDEWSRAAEAVGVNLFEVIEAIRYRKGTHDNIRQPGFGVGGYCLPKDGLLADWGLSSLLGAPGELEMTRRAIRINRAMPLRALHLVEQGMGGSLQGVHVGVAGISYLAGVGDTRNSPAEVFADEATRRGATVLATDPRVVSWEERPTIPLLTFDDLVGRCEAVVVAVGHREYRSLRPEDFGSRALVIVDGSGVLSEELARGLRAADHRVLGVGRGDWNAEDRRRQEDPTGAR